MIYQPAFRAYQRNYWPSDDLGQVFNWLLQRFLNCDAAHEILFSHAVEMYVLKTGLAECFALLEENMQSTNRLYLDMIQEPS